jgi:hypothetical protein
LKKAKNSEAKLKEESRDRVVDDAQEEEHDEEDDGICRQRPW